MCVVVPLLSTSSDLFLRLDLGVEVVESALTTCCDRSNRRLGYVDDGNALSRSAGTSRGLSQLLMWWVDAIGGGELADRSWWWTR